MVDAVNLQAVTFQRAPLCKGLFAVVAPIWADSCNRRWLEDVATKSSITNLYVFACASSGRMYH